MSSTTEQPLDARPSPAANHPGEIELKLSDVEAGLGSLPRAKFARFVSIFGALLVVAMVAYRWQEGRDRTTLTLVGLAILALLVINRNPAGRIAKRVYDSLPKEARRIAVTLNDDGLVLRSSGAESELAFADLWKITETRDVFVVFVSRENAQILPKRALATTDQDRLRTLARQKIVRRDEPFFTPQLQKRLTIWTLIFAVVWAAWYFFGQR
ncbi:MAG: YcxB family protein [Polyangiaceae bacterium]